MSNLKFFLMEEPLLCHNQKPLGYGREEKDSWIDKDR